MADTKNKTVEQLFTQIKKLGSDGYYNKALALIQEVLTRNPRDIDALKCKVVCLLKLDKCREAYHVMSADKDLQKLDFWFERAYALYRQNKLQEAIAELKNAEKSARTEELLAQIYYKLDSYEEAYNIYKALVKNIVDQNTNERETNLAATLASSAAFNTKPLKWVALRESTYELCYNSACYKLAVGDTDGAEERLHKAKELCKKEFEDDEQEFEYEQAPIQVMLGLCEQQRGNSKEAVTLYNNVIKEKHGDAQTVAVAANNIICINKDQNMFDSKKKLKLCTGEQVTKRLAQYQRHSIDFNSCLLSFYTNQLESFRNKSLELQQSGLDLAPLLLATYYNKEKKMDEAVKVLTDAPVRSLAVQLALAQLQKSKGDFEGCHKSLSGLSEFEGRPGYINILAGLLLHTAGPEKCIGYLEDALTKLRSSGSYSASQLNEWTISLARFVLSQNLPQRSATILEYLLSRDSTNIKALALLIRSVSLFDAPRAKDVAQRLPEIQIPSEINLEELEMGVGVTSGRGLRKVIQPEEEKIKEANRRFETKEKKQKKKKGKLPKVLVEGGPDPERWLPRQERSYFRRKKKNRNDAIGKGSQGLSAYSAHVEAALDMSNKKAEPTAAAASGSAANDAKPPPPKQQPKNKQKGKKKGKGKW